MPQLDTRPLTLGEEVRVALDEFAVHSSPGQPPQRLDLLLFTSGRVNHVHCDFFYFIDGHRTRSSETLDDSLCANTLLNQFPDLLQDFTRKDDN